MIKTKRLTLEAISIKNLNDLVDFVYDKDIKYMVYYPHNNIKETEDFIKEASENFKNNKDLEFAVYLDSLVIELVSLYRYSKNTLELGYIMNHKYQGLGYATEALEALIDYGFNTLKINSLVAHIDSRNEKSIKLIEKLSFTFVSENFDRINKQEAVKVKDYFYKLEK